MSERIGKIITCDRCGKQVFLNYIRTEAFGGGYSKIDYFEKRPEGWELGWRVGMLCPECFAEYEKLVETFMQECKPEWGMLHKAAE